MFSHPNSIITSADLHREELLAMAARERSAAGVSGPAIDWRSLAAGVAAVVALVFGLRA